MAELAPAMAVHYFAGTGWAFGAWEPTTKLGDVDVELVAPSGQRVAVQVKAPDEPAGYDERVFAALEHGRQQLEGAEQPAMLVVCAHRGYSLAAHPDIVVDHLLGLTTEVASANGFLGPECIGARAIG
jgi:small ligand-binding sensory domain FIST